MIKVLVWLRVNDPADVPQVAELLREHGRLSRAEPGCLRFEAYQSNNESQRFCLCEYWESQAALDVHRTAQGYTTIYQPQVLPRVTREAHPVTLLD